MIGRQYFVRQAATLLKFAKSTNNPELSAVLIEKAAELTSQVDATGAADKSHVAPDVEPEPRGDHGGYQLTQSRSDSPDP